MRKFLAAALLIGTATLATSAAEARDGCGRNAYRGPAGVCRPLYRGRVVAPRLVIGRFYTGRGYWNGNRYYQHRYRRGGGWRYR